MGKRMTAPNGEYHGIILNLSQRDKDIFRSLRIVGGKGFLLGLIRFYKVSVKGSQLPEVINRVRANVTDRILFKRLSFYAHFYRENELIIVYKDRVFSITTEKSSWSEAIGYGKSLGIPASQLDFYPCKVDDEYY